MQPAGVDFGFRVGRGEDGGRRRRRRLRLREAPAGGSGCARGSAGIVDGVVGGDGLDQGAAGLQSPAEPRVGDVGLRQQHAARPPGQMSSRPAPDCWPAGARSTAMPRDSRHAAGGRADRGHLQAAGQPGAEVRAAFGGLRLEGLDGGHAADHEPGVGPGAERIEGDVEGVLVAGHARSRSAAAAAARRRPRGGRTPAPGPVRAARDQDPGAFKHPAGGRARPRPAGVLAAAPSHHGGIRRFRKRPGPRCRQRRAASRTSASSIPSRVAPTSVSPSVAFLSRTVAVPSTAQTTASRCSMLPLR